MSIPTMRDRILSHQRKHPECTPGELAAALGVTRQRIYQVIQKYNLPVSRRSTRQYCSPEELTGGVRTLNSRTNGTLSELLVAADLVSRGYAVYRPVVEHKAYDILAVTPSGDIRSLEVRTAKRTISGAVAYGGGDSRLKCDVLALVVHGEPVQYRPEIESYAIGGSFAAKALGK